MQELTAQGSARTQPKLAMEIQATEPMTKQRQERQR